MSLLVDKYVRVSAGLAAKERDPLAWWHFAVPRLKQAFALFTADDPIDELHLRACNKGGKTETVAAWMLACMMKLKALDGVPLPQWRGPVEGAQLVLDYKQQLLSVQPAYLRLIGKWPHHPRYTGEVLSSLAVMPEGGDPKNESDWSIIHFLSQENKRSGVGVRGDIIAFDEPPVIEILRELRKAAHAGRRSTIVIGETPTVRRQWAPLKEDYGDCPRRTLRRVDRERAEVRWSLDEVADWVLSAAEKAKLIRRYKGDPLFGEDGGARLHGDYEITEGACPFHVPTLTLMLEECRDPEIVPWRVSRETTNGQAGIVTVELEVWRPPAKGFEYYAPVDPAAGIDDNHHDPLGLHVNRIGPADLDVRYVGYISPYSIGVLQAGVCRQYNQATADIEVNDRWGINVLHGLEDSRYGNLARERRELRPGEWSEEIGFHNDAKTRPAIIGAVQEWVESWRAGKKYGLCPSRKVINCLLDCILDADGKIVGAPGVHDEDLILRGQSLRRAATRSGREIPEIYKPPQTNLDKIAAKIRGEQVDDDEAPWPQVAFMPRERPRF